MNYNDSLVQLIKNLTQNQDDDTDPNNVLIQQFQAPYEDNKTSDLATVIKWGGVPYWASANFATFTRTSSAYNLDGSYVGYNPRFFGKGILLEEATTNLIQNGSAQGSLARWVLNKGPGSDATMSRISNDGAVGDNCVECYVGTFGSWSVWQQMFYQYSSSPYFDTSKQYTLSFYSKLVSGATNRLTVSIRDSNGTNLVLDATDFYLTDTWQRYTVTFTPLIAGNQPTIYFTVPSTPSTFRIDGFQLEQKSFATSYTDGTRQADCMDVPTSGVFDPSEGTLEVVLSTPNVYSWNNYFSMNISTGRFLLFYNSGGIVSWDYGATSNSISTGTGMAVANKPLTIAMRWSASVGTREMFVNGTKIGSLAFNAPTSASIPATMRFVNTGTAIIYDLRVSNVARTDDELIGNYSKGTLPVDAYTTAKYDFDDDLSNSAPALGFNWSQGGKYVEKLEVTQCLMLI